MTTKLLDDIRKAIKASGQSCYRIAKETGVATSQLSRFLNGERGLSVESLTVLCDYLGLEIVLRKKKGGR